MSRRTHRFGDIEIISDVNLEQLLSTSKEMREGLEKAISAIMWMARNSTSQDVRKYIANNSRDAHRAVRNTVYRKVIGGDINILNRKHAARAGQVHAPSNRYGNVTGPLRMRTKKTLRAQSYSDKDLGYLLRFISIGTTKRGQTPVTHMDGKVIDMTRRARIREQRDNYHNKLRGEKFKGRIGNRGVIKAKQFFPKEASSELAKMASKFQMEVDTLIVKILKYG